MQSISTIGNATLIAYDQHAPIISTDPWFGDEDDAYFGTFLDKSAQILNRFLTNRNSRSRRLLKSLYYKIK